MKGSIKLIIGAVVVVLLGVPIAGQLARTPAATVSTSAPRAMAEAPAAKPVSASASQQPETPSVPPSAQGASGVIESAYRNHATSIPVVATGTVSRILPDDNKGSRHQRFIVRLPSGHTVLIAHNIDIAARIDSLREGDSISFSGVYEWNEKGGTVHWTHHDPSGRHAGGYLRHNGASYQ